MPFDQRNVAPQEKASECRGQASADCVGRYAAARVAQRHLGAEGGDLRRLAIAVRALGRDPLSAQATRIYCLRTDTPVSVSENGSGS